MNTAELLHEVVGVPSSAAGKLLVQHFTPIAVSAPQLGEGVLAWLELYQLRAYPMAYYVGATISRIR